jgi:oligopeptide transport system substrate-binding protein
LDNQSESRFVLKKNPGYWDAAKVKLTQVTMTNYEDQKEDFQNYQEGKTDLVVANDLWSYDGFLNNLAGMADYRVTSALGTYFYRLNTTKPPLDNPKVRQALLLAIDRSLIPSVMEIPFLPATALTPSVVGFTPPSWAKFDPKAAKALLAEAGYPEGQGFPETGILFNNSPISHRQIAKFVQSQWKQNLGINVSLKAAEWQDYLDSVSNLNYQVARAGWIGDFLDPTTFLDMFITNDSNNNTGWSSAEYDLLVKKVHSEPNPDKRNEIDTQLETLLGKEAPIIPLYYYVWFDLVRPEVQGYYPNLLDKHPLKFVSIKE